MSSNISTALTATSSAVLSDAHFLQGLSDNSSDTRSSSDSCAKKAFSDKLTRKSKKIVKNKSSRRQNLSKNNSKALIEKVIKQMQLPCNRIEEIEKSKLSPCIP